MTSWARGVVRAASWARLYVLSLSKLDLSELLCQSLVVQESVLSSKSTAWPDDPLPVVHYDLLGTRRALSCMGSPRRSAALQAGSFQARVLVSGCTGACPVLQVCSLARRSAASSALRPPLHAATCAQRHGLAATSCRSPSGIFPSSYVGLWLLRSLSCPPSLQPGPTV